MNRLRVLVPRACEWARLLAVGLAVSIPAAATAVERTPYPVSLRIAEPGGAHVRYARAPSTSSTWPPEPSGTADLTVQTRAAYAAAAARMFHPAAPGADVDLELAVSISGADVDSRSSGSTAWIEHLVVLRTSANEELGEWRVRGDEPFLGASESAMEAAFARAAREAAEEFEARFEEPPGVAAWLRERGIPPRALGSRLESRVEAPWPAGHLAGFFEVSGDKLSGVYGADTWRENSSQVFVVGVRGGVATGRLRAALSYQGWSSAFSGDYQGTYDVRSKALGLEFGPRFQTRSGVDIHGGAGIHRLWIKTHFEPSQTWYAPPPDTAGSQFVLSVFGALGYARCLATTGLCFAGGLEARRYLGATMESPPIDVARLSFGAYLRGEMQFVP